MTDFDPKSFWGERWAEGRTAFHQSAVHPTLLGERGAFLGDGPHRVLVPLCGKSWDLPWLADQGHDVVGVEIVRQAVEALFVEHGRTARIENPADAPGIDVYVADRLAVWCSDFFDVPASAGPFSRVWDRAALVAVPPERRADYIAQLRRLAPGARLWLTTIDYDVGAIPGPPHAVPPAIVHELLAPDEPEMHTRTNLADDVTTRWAQAGLTRFDVTLWSVQLSPP